jgi:putative SOS response-associated peptidase YedK
MCGRFTLRQPDLLADRFQATLDLAGDLPPRFNVAPTQPAPIVVEEPEGRLVRAARWGLIPSWAKDPSIGNRLINARGETLAEKPSFRAALRSRRCLVPADGFFEWHRADAKRKTPYFIHRRDDGLFAFAGLYERWRDPAGDFVTSFTIITTTPNEAIAAGGPDHSSLHDRMPVILLPEEEGLWLDPATGDTDVWRHLVRPYPSDLIDLYPVSTLVNSPANDLPATVERA